MHVLVHWHSGCAPVRVHSNEHNRQIADACSLHSPACLISKSVGVAAQETAQMHMKTLTHDTSGTAFAYVKQFSIQR